MDTAREDILGSLRRALGREPASAVPAPPPTARVAPRTAGPVADEIEMLLAEIRNLSGSTRRLAGRDALGPALAELVAAEAVRKAVLWSTPELVSLDVAGTLRGLGVEIVPAQAGAARVAECDLGVTGVDAALPETGTLVLRSSPERPRLVSLLPRVHLALLRSEALRPDLHQALAEVRGDGYCVFVTGPSRTADIRLTLTLGVHGPGALHVWLLETP